MSENETYAQLVRHSRKVTVLSIRLLKELPKVSAEYCWKWDGDTESFDLLSRLNHGRIIGFIHRLRVDGSEKWAGVALRAGDSEHGSLPSSDTLAEAGEVLATFTGAK